MNEPIAFVDLKSQYATHKHAIDARIHAVLDHGQYIMGPEVRELETRLQDYTGAAHCVTVASGTEALLISLMALHIKPGDEVITSPFTFAASGETIALLGAKPVFVDIEPDTCNIDASAIEAKITARTRAIMPVSLYGQCSDMTAINAIAQRHGLAVVEDGAQSLGAEYQGNKSGNLSTLACTSFFPSKPLGCYGDGGAIFTSDAALAQACRELRVHGQSARYTHTRIGVGGRMDTLQCAIVLAKLEAFDAEVQRRIELGNVYREALAAVDAPVRMVTVRPDRTSVWAQLTVFADDRSAVQQSLQAQGIPTAIHYPISLHRQPAYAHFCCPECCPVSDSAAARVLSLPMSAALTDETVWRIARACASA